MLQTPLIQSSRIDLVDALRGFALFAIVLLHNVEQFNILNAPAYLPEFMKEIDHWVEVAMFFLFGGKAYAIFSLLFGFSFYIQMKNQAERGVDFRLRFIWRLVLLFGFGLFHSLFYPGDILVLYAVVGLSLIPVSKISDKALLITAIVLMLQPLEWARMVYVLIDPSYCIEGGGYVKYYIPVREAITEGSILQMMYVNLKDGLLYCNIWAIENGRLFQTSSLFMFGMLLGRLNLYTKSDQSLRFWRRVLPISAVCFVPLYALRLGLPYMIETGTILTSTKILALSLSNFAFMGVLTSGFILLWYSGRFAKLQQAFVPYGRMSLTNYIMQTIIGTSIYFGWGLGMYRFFGVSMDLMVGVLIFVAQLQFSKWWIARHRQGPFEYLWKRATFVGANKAIFSREKR